MNRGAGRRLRVATVEATCPCTKTAYATRDDAVRAAKVARRRAHEPIHDYRCPAGFWHIGHQMRSTA